MSAATALVALAAPSLFAGTIFQASTDAVVDTMVRMTGATLITSAATKYTLKVSSRGQVCTVPIQLDLHRTCSMHGVWELGGREGIHEDLTSIVLIVARSYPFLMPLSCLHASGVINKGQVMSGFQRPSTFPMKL
jgi:hypothetical protein